MTQSISCGKFRVRVYGGSATAAGGAAGAAMGGAGGAGAGPQPGNNINPIRTWHTLVRISFSPSALARVAADIP
jgi:hypothetical protein